MGTGTEAVWVPAVLSAVGTAATVSASEKAASERKRAIMQGVEEEAAVQDKSNARTNEFVQQTFAPTTRTANYEAEAGKAEKSFGELLASQAGQGQGEINPATTGAVSNEYLRSKASSTAQAAERARTLSRLMARGGATGGMMGRESLAGSDYASDMLGFGAQSRTAQRGTGVRLGQASNAGQDMALLGGLLGAGSQYAGSVQQQPKKTGP